MKSLVKLSAHLFGIGLSLFLFTCKKDNPDNSLRSSSSGNNSPGGSSQINLPPIANAGADVALNRTSCAPSNIQLDGSKSSDPEHYNLLYEWTKLFGDSCSLSDSNTKNATVSIPQAGQYAFELKVTDNKGLSSKDTVIINVSGSPQPAEANLGVNATGYYSFRVDKPLTVEDSMINGFICQVFGISPCPPPKRRARTSFVTFLDVATIGQFQLNVDETADTSVASNNHQTSISLSANNGASWVLGDCSVNFKQLIIQGGGSFNGTWQINYGSAQGCDRNIYTNLSPLTVSGTLDTTRHTVNVMLKGKTYF